MFQINNKIDAQIAWYMLKTNEEHPFDKQDHIPELKRNVRKYSHKPVKEERIIRDTFDDCIRLYPLPERITSEDVAKEYFEEFERVHYYPSPYDCTGQWWTTGYKLINKHGRWWVYHFMSHDV